MYVMTTSTTDQPRRNLGQEQESLFRIIDRGITYRENAEYTKEINESLNALEGGKIVS